MVGIQVGRKGARLAALDAVMIASALFASAFVLRPSAGLSVVGDILVHWTGATTLVLLLHLATFYVFELYNLRLDFRTFKNVLRCVAAVMVAGLLVAVASFAVPEWGLSRRLFLLHGVILTALTVANRRVASWSASHSMPPVRALLVTVGVTPDHVVEEFFKNPESHFHMVGSVPVGAAPSVSRSGSIPPPVGSVPDAEAALAREHTQHLIVAGIDRLPKTEAVELLRLKGKGVEVHDLNDLYRALAGRIPLELVDERYFLRVPEFTRDTRPVLSNLLRVLDVVGAGALMVLSSPLWLLAAAGIKLTMPGPVFYSQERVGKDERPYVIHKFRSMRTDAERDGPRWSQGPVDPRVTPFGRFLRRTRVDELPQLWNVLTGDMSLVGPRPERPVFVAELKAQIPFYALRFQVKPGVTGWAQVNYRYGASVDDTRVKLSYDLFYVQERSVPLYVLTLMKTVTTVLFKPGS